MKKITIVFLMLAALRITAHPSPLNLRPNMLFAARLDGKQSVPAQNGTGTGIASFMLNEKRDSMCVNVTITGLSGAATAVNLCQGAPGIAGTIVLDLKPYLRGNRLTGIITGSALTQKLISDMLKGLTYVNVHTDANPAGEIRGQIMLETDISYTARIDGPQAGTSATATGYAVFNVSQDEKRVTFYMITTGLTGPITYAHIHAGAVGQNGGVIQDLQTFVSGNIITGTFTPGVNLVSNLKNGKAYVNLHTNAFIQGEVRGQLVKDDKLSFDAWLDGAQEVPAVTTNAKGLAGLKINTTLDTLWYYVFTNGLSGSVTGSHIHYGKPGVSGGVAAGFSSATGDIITGIITGAALTPALINSMLTGAAYVNVHTAANPAGEIRGQIYRVMREGYTISMDGPQQLPPVNSEGSGSGIVSVDRDMDHAHYMLVTDNIAATGVQFQQGMYGNAGPVLNDIFTKYTNNSAFAFWKTSDPSPLTPFSHLIADVLDNDNVYVSILTNAYPGGEIRGQVRAGFHCIESVVSDFTGLTQYGAGSANRVFCFPNPASGKTILSYSTSKTGPVTITAANLLGERIFSKNFSAASGSNIFEIGLAEVPAGVYMITLRAGLQETTSRLIIQ